MPCKRKPKPKPKKKVGRPSKYSKKYCKEIIEFFDMEPYEDVKLPHYDKEGNLKWEDIKRMPNKLPTVNNFAKHIGVHIDTIYEWLKKHMEFCEAFTRAKELQKWFLIENGLSGLYNPAFAIFVAKNITDMVDETDHKHKHTIKLNDKQLEQLIRLRARRNNSGRGSKKRTT